MAFKAIPVAASQVTGTHTDFPVLVAPSEITDLGAITLAEAQSSRFYSDEAMTTELAREVVSADEIYVKVPSLSSSTIIYMDHDGVRSDYGDTDTYGRDATWSNAFLVVLHLEDFSSLDDSSGNGNDASTSGMSSGDIAAAAIGDGFIGDQSNNQMTLPTTDFVSLAAYTTTAMVRRTSSSSGWLAGIYQAGGALRKLYWAVPASIGNSAWYTRLNAAESYALACTAVPTLNAWNHCAWTHNSTDRVFYVSGADAGNDSPGTDITPAARTSEDEVGIGGVKYSNALNSMANQPDLDEFRIADVVRSADWVEAESNNLEDNSSFWGAATDAGGGGGGGVVAPASLMRAGL